MPPLSTCVEEVRAPRSGPRRLITPPPSAQTWRAGLRSVRCCANYEQDEDPNNTTIKPWGRGYIINNLLIWSDARARMMSRRMMSSFSSSFFDVSTTTTVTEDAEAPAKDDFEKEAAECTAGPTDSSMPSQRRTEMVTPPHHHQSSSMSLNNQQTSIKTIDK